MFKAKAVLLSLQQKYEECEVFIQKMMSDFKSLDNPICLRCNLLLIEIYLSLYRMKGETKEVRIPILIQRSGCTRNAFLFLLKLSLLYQSIHRTSV